MPENSNNLLYRKIRELADIPESSMEQLFKIAAEQQLKKGEVILKEGRICKQVIFVKNGFLRTYIMKDGLEMNTEFTFEGSFTTNLKSLRTSTPSETTIQAAEPAIVYVFDKDELLSLYNLSSQIESFGRKLLEQIIIIKEEYSNLFKYSSATQKYRYLQEHQPEMLQRISLSQLSSYLGVSRETLSRIRQKIK